MSKIKFRVAKDGDIDLLTELSVRTFSETFSASNTAENMKKYITAHFNYPSFRSELESDNILYFIISHGNVDIGYFKLRLNAYFDSLESYNPVEIARLYILNAYQRKGIGTKCIKYIIDLCLKNGYNLIWLAVWEHNHEAIAFYESMGLIKFAIKPFKLGDDIQNDYCYKMILSE